MDSSFVIKLARLVVKWYSTPNLYAIPPKIPRSAAEVYVPLSVEHVSFATTMHGFAKSMQGRECYVQSTSS